MGCCLSQQKKYKSTDTQDSGGIMIQHPNIQNELEDRLPLPDTQSINLAHPSANLLKRQESLLILKAIKKQNKQYKKFSQGELYSELAEIDRLIFDQRCCQNQPNLHLVQQKHFRDNNFHNHIGALLCKHPLDPTKEIKATAVLISKNLILTSAHNFYDKHSDCQTVDHKFYLALNGKLQTAKFYKITEFYYPQEFQIFLSAESDFAIAKLQSQVTGIDKKNLLSLAFGFKDLQAEISIYGYPADNNYIVASDGSRTAYQQGLCKKQLRYIENNIISYKITTYPGQSGCPVVAGRNKNWIVGVHKAGSIQNDETYNIGRHVSLDMILRMDIWRQKCNGEKFKVFDVKSQKQVDLSSPLFEEMKLTFIGEQRKNNKFKKIFQRNINSKQNEIEANETEINKLKEQVDQYNQRTAWLQQQISKQKQQNSQTVGQLQKELKQRNRDISNTNKKIQELEKINNQLIKHFTEFNTELSSLNIDNQALKKSIAQSQKLLRNVAQKVKEIRSCLIPQGELYQLTQRKEFVPYELIWDPQSRYASKFRISQDTTTLQMIKDDSMYQIVSLRPFQKNRKTRVTFQLAQYGGNQEIGLGILCQQRRKTQLSGRHIGSVGYFTRKENAEKRQGWIWADEKQIHKPQSRFYVGEGEKLQMIVDLTRIRKPLVIFRKGKNPLVQLKLELGEIFRREEIYVFCNMYCKGDKVVTVAQQ